MELLKYSVIAFILCGIASIYYFVIAEYSLCVMELLLALVNLSGTIDYINYRKQRNASDSCE